MILSPTRNEKMVQANVGAWDFTHLQSDRVDMRLCLVELVNLPLSGKVNAPLISIDSRPLQIIGLGRAGPTPKGHYDTFVSKHRLKILIRIRVGSIWIHIFGPTTTQMG